MLRADRKLTLILVLVFLFQCLTMAGAFSNADDVAVDISIPAINLTSLTITHDSAELVWVSRDNSVQASSYDLYRNDVFLKTITSFTYTDTGLSPQTKYSYYVKTKGSDGKEIADSNVFSITTRQAAEASTLIPPANLSVSDVTDTSVKLTWEAETTTPGAICYIVYSGQTILNTTIDTSYTVENLTPGTEYTFAVAVQDETGVISDPCSPVTVKTLDAKTTEDNFSEGILRSANPDFQTDRYIIKYKNDRGRDELNRVLEEKGLKNLKGNKVNHLDVILLDRKINIKDFVKKLKDNHLDSDIEYIQPDYQLSLSSDDPLYSSQWGLENAPQAEVNPDGMPMRERLDMLPPHLRDAVERSPELKDFLLSTPQEEIRMRLMGRGAPGDVPPEMLLELANDPVFMDIGNAPS
jgi:chitodextrinase